MKVAMYDYTQSYFKDLEVGQSFIFRHTLFMVVDKVVKSDHGEVNVVDIETGKFRFFCDSTLVIPVDAVAVVKER